MLASPQFGIHIPFWVMLFVASGVAALFGILLGAPTLRLRGDYLAIVTLGFGEIVPQTFLNLSQWTGGPNGIGSLDQPSVFGYRFGFQALPYYYLILLLIAVAVLAATNLRNSRLGRAWMAIREDELAAPTSASTRPLPNSRRCHRRVVQRPRRLRVRIEIAVGVARPIRLQRQRAVLSMLVLAAWETSRA